MPLREKHYVTRPDKYFHKVYNAGIADIGSKEEIYDDFGTPVGKQEFTSVMKVWYRHLGVTASDIFYARADNTEVKKKIAIKGYVDIKTSWHVKFTNKENYAIYRVYYNYRNDETELNLIEVIK